MRDKKGQVAPFMIMVVAVVLLAVVATMFLGEVGFERIRIANTTDSSLISGASGLCRTLNQVRKLNGQLMLRWVWLQWYIWFHWDVCCGPVMGWTWPRTPYTDIQVLQQVMDAQNIYKQAEKLVEDAAENLRVGLYDSVFAGALIDEPKPFREDEVIWGADGRAKGFNYQKYLKRIASDPEFFEGRYLNFKKTNKDSWFKNNLLSYSFDKNKPHYFSYFPWRSDIIVGEPVGYPNDYDAYLRTELVNVPIRIEVHNQWFPPIPYIQWFHGFWGCPCFPVWLVFIYPYTHLHLYIDSREFGLDVRKSSSLVKFPFFGREVRLGQKNKVKILGSVGDLNFLLPNFGDVFEFRMEE